MAVVDYFLKIDGIPGESLDHKHKDEIELIGWSWGEQNLARQTGGGGGGGGVGRVSMQDFHFSTHTSKASPSLFLACASGKHIASAVLTVRKAGEVAFEFLVYKLNDVLVTSFTNTGVDGGDQLPLDTFSLNFLKIEIDYTQENADGKAGQTFRAGWDLRRNQKF